jgi:hypothetical protein
MARLLSLFSALKRRVHQILFEESDHPFAPVRGKRRILHNALLIQGWAAMIGIFAILLAPIMVWFLSVPYLIPGYVCFACVGLIVEVTLAVSHKIQTRGD